MSPAGDPADTPWTGYEHWWTLSECVRLLHGATETLRIETLGAGRAALAATTSTRRELHHARRAPAGRAWPLAALVAGSAGVLRTAGDRLAGNDDRFVFVSDSGAPELADLCARARDAESAAAFDHDLQNARTLRAGLAQLLRCWICDLPAAVERLQRLDVRTVGERDLERRVRWGLQALFLAEENRIAADLLALLADVGQRAVTRREIVERLARRGCRPRRLDAPQQAGAAVAAATDRYLESARRLLIGGAVRPRAAAAKLRARLEGPASESVLTGRTGAGKTACVVAVVDAMRARNVPVLAFRIDHVVSAATTTDVGRRLDLEESPVLTLAEAARAAGRAGVLIVDQLDAVNSLAGAEADPCALVEQLLHEARGSRDRAELHAVVVCRAFDWRNDPRLRRLLPVAEAQIDVPALTRDEVLRILADGGCDPSSFGERELAVLQLPQHLALLLRSGPGASRPATFSTATTLFDRYWTSSRRAVAERAAPLPDQWMTAVGTLCDEMTAARQLTAPCERLDEVSPAYLEHLAAEGVITVDGRRCGFGHETFFDYCAARVSFSRRQPLAQTLADSEQHLLRRAAVRQALGYLRDADSAQYVRELGDLLADRRIRAHVKDLAFAWLADVPDPTEQEWSLWRRWLDPALDAVAAGAPNPDRLSALAWRRFLDSPSWFRFVDRRGVVEGWLAADNERLAAAAVSYLGRHVAAAPDLVAALLEPYAGTGGAWPARLRFFMERADRHANRRLFELFLRLVDDGTLDEARDRDAAHGTFWSMLGSLGEDRPEWVPEVLAHRLRRRLAIIRSAGEDLGSRELPGYDAAAARLFDRAAQHAAPAFVEHVLHPVLEISDATLTGERPPKHDAVWPVVAGTAFPEVDHACLAALSTALATLAGDAGADLQAVIADLRRRDTHIANHLLLAVYRGGAAHRADEAAALLCDEPWRFECGFSDSPQRFATETLQAVLPHCSAGSRERIEGVLLEYVAPDERGLRGFRHAGRARFALLAAIPDEARSPRVNADLQALERRFGKREADPRAIAVDADEPPIDDIAAPALDDAQWLSAIAQHGPQTAAPAAHAELPQDRAWDLARRLEAQVGTDPDRFARLALRLPADAHPAYLERMLTALRHAAVEADLKLQVCLKAFAEARETCGRPLAGALGSLADPLPADAVRMLHWLATEHADPVATTWQVEDVGVDSVRGSAAAAIAELITRDAACIERFRVTIERLIHDPSAPVRACAAETLQAVTGHDPALGMALFHRLDLADDRLLATPQVYGFVRAGLRDRFTDVGPLVQRMLRSAEPHVAEAGARLASLAALEHAGAAARSAAAASGADATAVHGNDPAAGAAQTAEAGAVHGNDPAAGAAQTAAGTPFAIDDLPAPATSAAGAAPAAHDVTDAAPRPRTPAELAADAVRGSAAQRLGVAQVAAANLATADYRTWSAATLRTLFDDDDAGVRRQAAACFRHLQDTPLDTHADLIEAFCASQAFADDSASILDALEASHERLPGATYTVCEQFLERFANEVRDPRSPRHAEALTVATLAFRTCQQHQHDEWTGRALDLIDRLCLEQIADAPDALERFER